MAISGKPPKPSPALPTTTPSEQEVFSLINKGGSIAKPATSPIGPDDIKPMLVQLRLYPDLVEEIDSVRKSTKGKRPRPPLAMPGSSVPSKRSCPATSQGRNCLLCLGFPTKATSKLTLFST